ncbi:hypothetical protein [Candidatus Electronema sp. TJ]|uniref:hypothetical protein n=1 Tax=Candidatus Electronema sp. TJ TaxID=3401573 RepID=UPI003AA8D95E
MNHGSMRCVLLAAAFALTVSGISTAAEESERKYRSTPDGEGALTQEMIEQCITLKREIGKSRAEFQGIETRHDAVSKEADEQAETLKASRDLADYDYKGELAKYKEKLAEADKLYNEMQAKKTAYDQQTAKFDQQCNNQPSYEDDNAAAAKKMGEAL